MNSFISYLMYHFKKRLKLYILSLEKPLQMRYKFSSKVRNDYYKYCLIKKCKIYSEIINSFTTTGCYQNLNANHKKHYALYSKDV